MLGPPHGSYAITVLRSVNRGRRIEAGPVRSPARIIQFSEKAAVTFEFGGAGVLNACSRRSFIACRASCFFCWTKAAPGSCAISRPRSCRHARPDHPLQRALAEVHGRRRTLQPRPRLRGRSPRARQAAQRPAHVDERMRSGAKSTSAGHGTPLPRRRVRRRSAGTIGI